MAFQDESLLTIPDVLQYMMQLVCVFDNDNFFRYIKTSQSLSLFLPCLDVPG